MKELRTIGRNTQGVRLIKLDENDVVSSLAKLPEDEIVDAPDVETRPAGEAPDGEPASGSNGAVSLHPESMMPDDRDATDGDDSGDPAAGEGEPE